MRSLAWCTLPALALSGGCTCGAKTSPAPEATPSIASAAPSAPASPAAAADAGAAVFSSPIAGARVAGADVVAGLVASAGVVRVMELRDGRPVWTADALRDVRWAPDCDLQLRPAAGGVAVVWRGPHAGKSGRILALLGERGNSRGDPFEVGSALCVTEDAATWIDDRASGARVLRRRWDAIPVGARTVATVPDGRDPSLVCGDHDVTVLGDGDDDLTAAAIVAGSPSAQPPFVLVRDADFGDDEEREHDAWSVGDDLGIVRFASSGAVAVREVPRGSPATPWRKLQHTVPADDDVVAVDGDASATVIVYTQDAQDACPGVGSTAESVHALRLDRKTGAETALDLAGPDCARSPGPFWIAATPRGPTVAWVDRTTSQAPKAAPISAAAFRVLAAGGPVVRRLERAADALVDCGCDASGCSVAALLRPPGGDGMQPEAIEILGYP